MTCARGYTWTASFDALGRQSGTLDPLGRRATLAFDGRSLPTGLTDGEGPVTTRTFDALGRQTGT